MTIGKTAMHCEFEQSSMCGFEQVNDTGGDWLDWTWNSGSTPSSRTGPSADHTCANKRGLLRNAIIHSYHKKNLYNSGPYILLLLSYLIFFSLSISLNHSLHFIFFFLWMTFLKDGSIVMIEYILSPFFQATMYL